MKDLEQLAKWLSPLIAGLSEAQVARLSYRIGQKIRRQTSLRIASQRNPDGSAFEARKKPSIKARISNKRGRVKRTMFTKMRTMRYLKIRVDKYGVGVGFLGRIGRIATVHQRGLTDSLGPSGPHYQYPARELLGWTHQDEQIIRDEVIEYIESLMKNK